jgi:hypothetical protein
MHAILVVPDTSQLNGALVAISTDVRSASDLLSPLSALLVGREGGGVAASEDVELKQIIILCSLMHTDCLSYLHTPREKWDCFVPELGRLTGLLYDGDCSMLSYLQDCRESWELS